jgi:hypothetical protein
MMMMMMMMMMMKAENLLVAKDEEEEHQWSSLHCFALDARTQVFSCEMNYLQVNIKMCDGAQIT